MNSTEQYRKTAVIGAAAATILLFAALPSALAGASTEHNRMSPGRHRVAVVHLKQISLNVRTIKKLNYKLPRPLLARAESVFGQE